MAFALGQRYLPINSVSQSDNFGRFLRLRIALHFNPQNVVSRRGQLPGFVLAVPAQRYRPGCLLLIV